MTQDLDTAGAVIGTNAALKAGGIGVKISGMVVSFGRKVADGIESMMASWDAACMRSYETQHRLEEQKRKGYYLAQWPIDRYGICYGRHRIF